MKKLILVACLIAVAAGAQAQDSGYGAVENFFMANPDLLSRAQYAGRPVTPNYLLINWDQQSEMDQRMISNGFVRLGISSWVHHPNIPYGGGIPEREEAVAYAHVIGADVVIYATMVEDEANIHHSVSFYAKEGSIICAPSDSRSGQCFHPEQCRRQSGHEPAAGCIR